jgi:hypothetical protein
MENAPMQNFKPTLAATSPVRKKREECGGNLAHQSAS